MENIFKRNHIRNVQSNSLINALLALFLVSFCHNQAFALIVAEPDQRLALQDNPIIISVLNNDTLDGATNVSITIESAPAGGTAIVQQSTIGNIQVIIYRSDAQFTGQDQLTYRVTNLDNVEDSAVSSVTVFVRAQDTEPSVGQQFNNTNQGQVIESIGRFCGPLVEKLGSGELTLYQRRLALRCNALLNALDGDNTKAFQKIAGEEMIAARDAAIEIAKTQKNNLNQRMSALRSGFTSQLDLTGLNILINDKIVPATAFASLYNTAVSESNANKDNDVATGLDSFSRWSFFLNGAIGNSDKETTDFEAGYDGSSQGFTLGGDYRLSSKAFIGLAIGKNSSDSTFVDNGGEMDTDTLTLLAYGSYYRERYYFDAVLGYANLDYNSARNIEYTITNVTDSETISTTANSDTSGSQIQLSLTGNVDLTNGPWTLSPYAAVNYIQTDIDAFAESNAGGWALAYDKQNIQSTTVSLGSRGSFVLNRPNYVLVTQLRIAALKELQDGKTEVGARFVYNNTSTNSQMTFLSDDPDTSYMEVAFGTSLVFTRGFSLFLDYEVITGLETLSQDMLTFGGRYEASF